MTDIFNRESEKPTRRQLRSAMPNAEVLLWIQLKGRQLLGCKFRRQFSVGPYVLDFYCAVLKLGIEIDGDSHFRVGARDRDEKRQSFIESFRIRVVRFLNTDIYDNIDGVLEVIAREVSERQGGRKQGRRMRSGEGDETGPTPPSPPFGRGGKGGSP